MFCSRIILNSFTFRALLTAVACLLLTSTCVHAQRFHPSERSNGSIGPQQIVKPAKPPAFEQIQPNARVAQAPVDIPQQMDSLPSDSQPRLPESWDAAVQSVPQDQGSSTRLDEGSRAWSIPGPGAQHAAPPASTGQSGREMWWNVLVRNPLDQRAPQQISTQSLIMHAIQNSPRILATSKQPLIQQTEIGTARADFDPDLFLQTQFDDRVDPVGNQLTTGTGDPFLEDNIWFLDSGFRRKLFNGAQFELNQRLGFQNSNSRFFDPQDQGTATLSLNYTQPLLRGRGRGFNTSQILIAELSTNATWDLFAAELQDELTDVTEAYWNLYFHRSSLLQKQHNVERGDTVLRRLEGRSGLDSLPSQVARARAAVQSRRTELANAIRDVKNAETDIRRLIGSHENFSAVTSELIPVESPQTYFVPEDLGVIIQTAIEQRPEVKQAIKRSRIAAVQKDVSVHELLPELNLIFSAYASALRGESDVLGAFSDQFTASTPGYAVGFEFNLPYGRRAARARNTRQQLVLEQVRFEIDQTMNDVVAESQIAWRQINSAHETVLAAAQAIEAARTDLLQNEARWESFALIEGDFAEGQTPTTLLDQLLDAQQRLTNAELTYSQAVLEFKTAEIALKRATGNLLNFYQGVPAQQNTQVIHQAPAQIAQPAPVAQPVPQTPVVRHRPAPVQPTIQTVNRPRVPTVATAPPENRSANQRSAIQPSANQRSANQHRRHPLATGNQRR